MLFVLVEIRRKAGVRDDGLVGASFALVLSKFVLVGVDVTNGTIAELVVVSGGSLSGIGNVEVTSCRTHFAFGVSWGVGVVAVAAVDAFCCSARSW